MDRLKADAVAMKNALLVGDVDAMARILDDSWAAKKLTAPGVSTERIDQLSKVAFANGALAGKVSGAGGGGFLIFNRPARRPARGDQRARCRRGRGGPRKIR